ncbi:unnamed protein product, partial [Brassica rapa]
QPRTSCVCWRTPTAVLYVLNRQTTWAKITQTVHGKGQRAESKDQRADMCTDGQQQTSSTDFLCVLADTHGRPVCTEQTDPNSPWTATDFLCVLTDTHGHTQTATDVLCVLTDTQGRPVQPTRAKITRTVHGEGQRVESKDQRADLQPLWDKISQTVHGKGQGAESKDQRADMCTDGQPRTSYTHRNTRTVTDVLCVMTDSHGCPVQPMWAKITRTVHGKGQRAESKDQCADMCTDGQPRTSYSPRGPKSPKQSTGRASMRSPRTNVPICVLMDRHRRPVCAGGHRRTHTDSHGRHVQPTWAKITQTVHGKGQRAESKDQRPHMCTDGQPRTSCTRTATDVLCVLTDTHGRPVCADPWTSCVCWQTPTDVLCLLNRQPTWAKITQTPTWAKIIRRVHGKGQRAESKDQRADMCTDGQPRTSCVNTWTHTDSHRHLVRADRQPRTATNVLCVLADTHGHPVCTDQTAQKGQNHPKSPEEGPACGVQEPMC